MHLDYRKCVVGILVLAVVAGLGFWAFRESGGGEELAVEQWVVAPVAEAAYYSEPIRLDIAEVSLGASVSVNEGEIKVVEERWSSNFDASGRGKRVRLLERDGFSYPVRSVETVIVDPLSGELSVLASMEMVADRILLRFKREQSLGELEAVAIRLKGVFERQVGARPLYQFRFDTYDLDSVPLALAFLSENLFLSDSLVYVEPDYIVHALVEPDDAKYLDGSLWGMHNTGQDSGAVDADIDAPEGWDIRTDSGDVIVAVIDSGVNYLHEDLAANMWVNAGEIPGNGIDDDGNGYVDDVHGINSIEETGDPMDDNGHGTHCSGTIGAVGNNGVGVTGVAWTTQIMGLKFLSESGSGTISDAIECVDYAVAMGASVLSNSWGGGGYSQAMFDAIQGAADEGVVFVAAAGNAGANTDAQVSYPAGYNVYNVISVAAMNREDELSSFSNYGIETVDLAAPGTGIESSWIDGTQAYKTISGTSMATPHVSGILTLLMAEYPEDGLRANLNRLIYSVELVDALEEKIRTGGRANLAAALALVDAPFPPVLLSRPDRRYYELVGGFVTVLVSVESELPVVYQWFHDDVLLVGESGLSLQLSDLNEVQSGEYRFEASNEDGVTVAKFELNVLSENAVLSDAVDNFFLSFASHGDAPWDVYFSDSAVGDTSIRSGKILDGESSTVFMKAQGPGMLNFHWRVSAETYWDYGQFLLDGQSHSVLRQQGDWREVSVLLEEARSYRLEWSYVKDGSGSVGQDSLYLDGLSFHSLGESPPVIVNQPDGTILGPDASYTLVVEALGDDLTYQWLLSGIEIPGAVEASLQVVADSPEKAGEYVVKVTNPFGAATSWVAFLQIGQVAALVVESPQSVSRESGQNVVFSVAVSGSLPMEFQWYKNGAPVLGATESRVELQGVDPSDEGVYFVSVRNAYSNGFVNSDTATLEIVDVDVGPQIIKQPSGGYWQEDESLRLSVGVEGSLPMTYRWYRNGELLTGDSLRVFERAVVAKEDDGTYYLVAENAHGSVSSEEVSVFIISDVGESLDLPSVRWEFSGGAYFFSQNEVTHDGVDALESSPVYSFLPVYSEIIAEIVGPTNFSIYWKQDVLLFPSSVGIYVDDVLQASMYSERDWHLVSARVEAGTHEVRISTANETGSTVWLDEASVDPAPVIYRQPESKILVSDDDLNLSVDGFGSGSILYQWYKNDALINGANSSSYSVSGSVDTLVGIYHIELTNEIGTTVSRDSIVEAVENVALEVGDGSVSLLLGETDSWRPWRTEEGELVLRSSVVDAGGERSLEAVVEGPGVLVFDLSVQSPGCCPYAELYLDGERVNQYIYRQDPSSALDLRELHLEIPIGTHQVRWRFQASENSQSGSEFGYLDNIRLTTKPVVTRQPRDVRVIEGDEARMSVSMFSEETHLYQWFKDGEAMEGETLDELTLRSVDAANDALYYCVVTDGDDESTQSDSAHVEVVLGFYDAVEVNFAQFQFGSEAWTPQSEMTWDGEDALEFSPESAGVISSLALRIHLPVGQRRTVRSMIKVDGLGPNGYVRVTENSGKSVRINMNTDWIEVVLPLGTPGSNTVFWTVHKGSSSNSDSLRVWIDSIELIDDPVFYREPSSVSTAYGAAVEFGADVVGFTPIAYQWSHGGEVLIGESEGLEPDDLVAQFSTSGTYQLVASNEDGSASSEDVDLSLVDVAFGAAAGMPGLLTTQGTELWEVSEDDSVTGPSSLKVEGLDAGESSELLFAVVGPGTISFSWKLESPTGREKLYCYIEDVLVSGLFASSGWEEFEFELKEAGLYHVRVEFQNIEASKDEGGRGWLDGLNFESSGGHRYEDWAQEELSGNEQANWDADPDGDGIANFAEYAFLLNPLSPDMVPQPRFIQEAEGGLQILLNFNAYGDANNVLIGLEISDNLVTWRPVAAQFIVSSEADNSGVLYFKIPPDERLESLYVRVAVYYLSASL